MDETFQLVPGSGASPVGKVLTIGFPHDLYWKKGGLGKEESASLASNGRNMFSYWIFHDFGSWWEQTRCWQTDHPTFFHKNAIIVVQRGWTVWSYSTYSPAFPWKCLDGVLILKNWVSMDIWFRPKRLRKRSWKMSFPHPFRWATVPWLYSDGEMRRFFEVPNSKKRKCQFFTKWPQKRQKSKPTRDSFSKLAFPSFPKLMCWGLLYRKMSLTKSFGVRCVFPHGSRRSKTSHLRRSSHGKSWRCGYGPRRLCHGGGQGWRYQGSKGRAVGWCWILIWKVGGCDFGCNKLCYVIYIKLCVYV